MRKEGNHSTVAFTASFEGLVGAGAAEVELLVGGGGGGGGGGAALGLAPTPRASESAPN